MAFADDADKRTSIRKGRRGKRVAPIPDGDISSAADRAHMAGLYRDKTYAAPPVMGPKHKGLLLGVY